jgi:GMP synthase (glutamine-hydrolysing)
VLLASNAFTHVQSVAITHKGGDFWGLQYHPEYDLHEMARLTWCRIDKLVKLGFFRDRPAAESFVNLLETLHQDPNRRDIAWLLGIDDDVMNEDVRLTEVRNWIDRLVIPSMAMQH